MTLEKLRERSRIGGDENIARYVGGSHIDPSTGVVNGSAFDRTPKDTDGVSVTRRGVFSNKPSSDETEIRRVVGSRLKLGATGVFAELNVGAIIDALAEFEQEVFVCADALPSVDDALANPAHALIAGLPFAGEAMGSLRSEVAGDKLRQIIIHTFPAVLKNVMGNMSA